MSKVEIFNHIISRGADIIAAEHLSQNEIHERQHYNCNIASDGEPPFCGNCMFEAYDPETNTSYEAFDGTQFDTESACLDYERDTFSYPNGTNVISVLNHIKSYCECRERCQKCPFNTCDNSGIENVQCVFDVDSPAEWDIKEIKENFNAGGK